MSGKGFVVAETPTREDDFDKELNYSLFDEFMDRVEAGELTWPEAVANYLSLVAVKKGLLDGSAQ